MRCGIPNAYILDKTMYKMHVSFVKRHMHFIHSFIKNVNIWDPTTHFKHFK